MKRRHIKVLTVLSLLAILTLQCIWLVNTYSIVEKETIQKINKVFKKTVEIESYLRLDDIKNTFQDDKVSLSMDFTIDEEDLDTDDYMSSSLNIAIQDFLASDYNLPVSLGRLDSIYKDKLAMAGVEKINVVCNIVDSIGNIINAREDVQLRKSSKTLQTAIIFINKEHTIGLQAIIINPYWIIFQRMSLLIIATAIIIIFVAYCIIYQIRIISNQNKIAQVREDFSYSMIHDMKNPLGSIMMCSNFLHSGRLDDKPELKEQYFKIIENESGHLLKLTDKILNISKLENNKLEMKPNAIELKPMFDGLISNFTAKAAKSLEIILDLKEEYIYADREYMEEVFNNLIDNAIKYSKESVTIKITSEKDENYSIVRFHDNGIGISEKDRKKIFNKFERGAAIKHTKSGGPSGFGLGLNYVSQVIEAHHGKIIINSIEGEFSEFILYIPLAVKNL